MYKVLPIILLLSLITSPANSWGGTVPPQVTQTQVFLPLARKQVELFYTTLDGYMPNLWRESYTFDDAGIPMVDYGEAIGLQYNPTTIAQYALSLWNTGQPDDRMEFFKVVHYLRNAGEPFGEDAVAYRYNFPIPTYEVQPGWVSAIAQGQVLSVLRRANAERPDGAYVDLARKVKNLMLLPVMQGGTYTVTPEGEVWLEEIPTLGQGNYGLDDFFSATIGLYDYTQMAPDDQETQRMFQACLKSIERSVGFYDNDAWVIHDRRKRQRVDENILNIQRNEMQHLYEITGEIFFINLAKKWAYYR